MKITEPTVLCPGVTAKPTSRGWTVVEIDVEADPIGLPPAILEQEKSRLGCKKQENGAWWYSWRYRREYMRDFDAQIGQLVFDNTALEALRPQLRNPIYTMDLDPSGRLERRRNGRVKIYKEPDSQPEQLDAALYEKVYGVAPPQYWGHIVRGCGMGIDVGEGVSASASAIEIFFADNFEQAAELDDSELTPSQIGRYAVAMARYYNDALICCVRKLHGITTLRSILDEGYHYIWHHRVADKDSNPRTSNLGWARGETSDELLFGNWVDAIDNRRIILHSLAAWGEHNQYIYDEMGRITMQSRADLPLEIRRRHGDMVVACALAYQACRDLPRFKNVVEREPTMIEKEMTRRAMQRKSLWRSNEDYGF